MFVNYILILLCLLIVIWWFTPAYTRSIRNQFGKRLKGSIASLESLTIGGVKQWLLIRGENINNPVLLFLHGGPGTSEMCLLRNYTAELEKHFVLVLWDQRGAGKSFDAKDPSTSMTINQFVSDTHELTKYLQHRFQKERLFLIGHSWGTVVGVLTAKNYPSLYYAYIGIGQIGNMIKGEQLSYSWTLEQARKAGHKAIADKLSSLGKPPYTGDWQKKTIIQRRYLGRYGGEVFGNSKGAIMIVVRTLLTATEYTLHDKINFFKGIFNSTRLLWPQLMKIDLPVQVPQLKLPVYFMLGRHDYEAPAKIAEEYFEVLQAPLKKIIWFEKSAHFPAIEENEKFNAYIVEVLSQTSMQKERTVEVPGKLLVKKINT